MILNDCRSRLTSCSKFGNSKQWSSCSNFRIACTWASWFPLGVASSISCSGPGIQVSEQALSTVLRAIVSASICCAKSINRHAVVFMILLCKFYSIHTWCEASRVWEYLKLRKCAVWENSQTDDIANLQVSQFLDWEYDVALNGEKLRHDRSPEAIPK